MLLLAIVHAIGLSVADGSQLEPGASLQLDWLAGGKVVSSKSVPVTGDRLSIEGPPTGAETLRVSGPAFLSRPVPVRRGLPARLVLVRGATLRLPPDTGAGRLLLLRQESPGLHEFREVDAEKRDLLLWPGTGVAILDSGPSRPLRATHVSLAPGGTYEPFHPPPSPDAASVLVRVRCEDESGQPVRGVSLSVSDAEDPLVRGLLLALKERSGSSGDDGILDLGLVPASIASLRLHAEGRRDAVVQRPDPGLPTAAALKAVLRPYASIRFRWNDRPGAEPGFHVVAEACASAERPEACPAWVPFADGRFDDSGIGRFTHLPPGWYRLSLRAEGPSLAYSEVELPWNSADPDPPEVSFEPLEWRLAGTVVDSDGQPVPGATVYAAPLVESGFGPPGVVEDRTRADGSFAMAFLSSVERVALAAESDEPAGATNATIVSSSDRTRTIERLVLQPGAVRIRVLSRISDEPLEGCSVTARSSHAGESSLLTKLSGADGTVTFRGTGDGVVVVKVSCDGYSPSTGTALEASSKLVEATIRLERAESVALRVVDRAGRAIVGARVLVPETSSSSDGFDAPVLPAGTTGPDGRLELPGERFGSSPAFILAPGRALGIGRLPGSQCASDDCDSVVVLGPPSSFGGATASSASGKAIPPVGLVFSYAGIPLPTAIVAELAAAHDLGGTRGVVGYGGNAVNVVPGLLPPGDYEVGYLVGSRQTGQIRAVPAGFLRLPASIPVDFRVHAVP